MKGSACARCDKSSFSSFVLLYVGLRLKFLYRMNAEYLQRIATAILFVTVESSNFRVNYFSSDI